MTTTKQLIPPIPASEVAKWYPYAVVRLMEEGACYVSSVHETPEEAAQRCVSMYELTGLTYEVRRVTP